MKKLFTKLARHFRSNARKATSRLTKRAPKLANLREDKTLIKVLHERFCNQTNITFCKVGANDGVTNDPCGMLLLEDTRWSGILIEPVPQLFMKLAARYSDTSRFTVVNAAVGRDHSKASFYFVSERAKGALPNLPYWYDQIGSFDKQHILNHLNGALEPFIETIEVAVHPLSSMIISTRFSKIDFLHIDTEGHDLIVLESLDFAIHAPTVILVEHKHLSADDHERLRGTLCMHQYSIIDLGNDLLATRGQK